jgi:hypothetical protein
LYVKINSKDSIDAIICEIYIGIFKNIFIGNDNNTAADGNGVATTTVAHKSIVLNNESITE